MAVSDKYILFCSDDPAAVEMGKMAVEPLVKTFHHAPRAADAIKRATLAVPDCFILRTSRPSLKDPAHIFAWAQKNKDAKTTPWIILGTDIEDAQISASFPQVRFLAQSDDGAGLVKMLNELFPHEAEPAAAPAPSTSPKADAAKEPKNPLVDAGFINPLVSAVIGTFKQAAKIDLKRGQPSLKAPDAADATSDLSGIVPMDSDRFQGSMALCFDKPLGLKASENMLGKAVPAVNNEVKDTVAKMMTDVFNSAQRELGPAGYRIRPASPSVQTDPHHGVRHAVNGLRLCLPFESPHGGLIVECVVNLKK